MTSSINPANIDGTFPIAGQDNESQGFRDNFTNIKTNFTEAKAEIEDLQNKVILKSALDGTTIDNSGGGAVLNDYELRDISETRVSKGTTNGTVTIDYEDGAYVTVTTNGNITLAFTKFPTAGKVGKVTLEVTVSSIVHTLTLPVAVSIGNDTLQGITSSNIITFDRTGTYIFEFKTDDAGTTISVEDKTRSRTKMDVRTPASTGQAGDFPGMFVVDSDYLYVCTGNYDASTVIWKRVAVTAF